VQRTLRLRSADDFRRVRRSGRSWSHPLLVLVAAPRPDGAGPTRLGVTSSKGVGGAVVRNRARRRVREAVRRRHPRLRPGWDLVVVVRSAAAEAAGPDLDRAVQAVLARSGLLAGEREEVACAPSRSA
jgi:ribonuclease P protein component